MELFKLFKNLFTNIFAPMGFQEFITDNGTTVNIIRLSIHLSSPPYSQAPPTRQTVQE